MNIDFSRIPDTDLEYFRRAVSGRPGWGWLLHPLDHENARRAGDFPPGPIELEAPPGSLKPWTAAVASLRDRSRDDGRVELEGALADLVAELVRLADLRECEARRLDALYRLDLDVDGADTEWTPAA